MGEYVLSVVWNSYILDPCLRTGGGLKKIKTLLWEEFIWGLSGEIRL